MDSNSIRFIFEDKIKEIENPDPNETILNLIRLRLKKTGTKKAVPKVAVEPVLLYWES